MKKNKLLFIVMTLALPSCSSLSTQKTIDDKPMMTNEPEDCNKQSKKGNAMKRPIPLDTGVLREESIDIIAKSLFIERLESSPLWTIGSYTNHYKRSFDLEQSNGFLQIQGDGSFSDSEKLTKINYSPLNVNERNKYGHQLLDEENFAMIEVINIIIDDRKTATEILDQLYEQYLVKVNNNDRLSDNMTLHTYIRYEGILFELWGTNQECKLSLLTGLTIS